MLSKRFSAIALGLVLVFGALNLLRGAHPARAAQGQPNTTPTMTGILSGFCNSGVQSGVAFLYGLGQVESMVCNVTDESTGAMPMPSAGTLLNLAATDSVGFSGTVVVTVFLCADTIRRCDLR